MDPRISLHATPKAWLLNSVLAPHAGSFFARLKHSHYSLATRRTKCAAYRASDSLLEFLKGL